MIFYTIGFFLQHFQFTQICCDVSPWLLRNVLSIGPYNYCDCYFEPCTNATYWRLVGWSVEPIALPFWPWSQFTSVTQVSRRGIICDSEQPGSPILAFFDPVGCFGKLVVRTFRQLMIKGHYLCFIFVRPIVTRFDSFRLKRLKFLVQSMTRIK